MSTFLLKNSERCYIIFRYDNIPKELETKMLDIPEYKEAEKVFHFFEQISKIPHTSSNTAQIADYLVNFAKERSLWYAIDDANNVLIRKAATPGYENRPTVIFQGHTDMVEDKLPDSDKDMLTEGDRKSVV